MNGLFFTTVLAFVCTAANAATLRVPAEFSTIQQAIDAAGKGDTVVVAAGTYRERLTLKPGVTLRSDGDDAKGKLGLKRAEAVILDGTGGSGPGVAMAEDAVLDGLTVTGVGVFDEKIWRHHFDTQGNEQPHEHIGEPGMAGIAVGARCSVLNNIVHHIGYTGIAVSGEKITPRIAGNVCFRNMGGGIGSMKGSAAVIEGNECFENLFAGIGCDASSPLIRGNTCRDNVRAGIGISEGSSPRVTENRCFRNRRAGIGIRTGADTRPVVEANDCADNLMAGIGVDEGAQPVLIKNKLTNNQLVAIGVTGKSSAIIKDNTLSREGGMPPMIAVLEGCNAVITGNTIRGGGVAAILVKGRAEIAGNQFVTTSTKANNAIWAHASADVTLGANTFEGWKEKLSAAKGAQVREAR